MQIPSPAAMLPGDVDGDGDVDDLDLVDAIERVGVATSGGTAPGDLDENGVRDLRTSAKVSSIDEHGIL